MASTDYDFTSTCAAIINAAYHRIGVISEQTTLGNTDAKVTSAMNVLNRLVKHLQNEDVFLWQLGAMSISVTATTTNSDVTSESNVIGIFSAFWRDGTGTSQWDKALTRISWHEFNNIADKNTTGEPTHIAFNQTTRKVWYWPVPDAAGTVVGQYISRLKDWDTAAGAAGDFPSNYELALTNLLSAELGMDYRIPMAECERYAQLGMAQLKKASIRDNRQSDRCVVKGAFD